MIIQRRTLLIGLASMFAAPAIVKAEWIMPVKKIVEPPFRFYSSLYKQEVTSEEFGRLIAADDRLGTKLFAREISAMGLLPLGDLG